MKEEEEEEKEEEEGRRGKAKVWVEAADLVLGCCPSWPAKKTQFLLLPSCLEATNEKPLWGRFAC